MATPIVKPAHIQALANAIHAGNISDVTDAVHQIASQSYDDSASDTMDDLGDDATAPDAGGKLAKLGSFAALCASLAGGIAASTTPDDVAQGLANDAAATAAFDVFRANGITSFNVEPTSDRPCPICADAEAGSPWSLDDDARPFVPLHEGCDCVCTADTSSDNTDDGGSQRSRRSDLDISMAAAFPLQMRALLDAERLRGPTTEPSDGLATHTRRWTPSYRGSPVLPVHHMQSLTCAIADVDAILAQQTAQTQVADSTDDPTKDKGTSVPSSSSLSDGTGTVTNPRARRSGRVVSKANAEKLTAARKLLALVHSAATQTQDVADGTGISPGNNPAGIGAPDGTGSRSKRAAAKYTADQLKQLHAAGKALKSPKDGHVLLPIADAEDLKNAISTAALVTHVSKQKARVHIQKQAKKLGLSFMIPDNWTKSGELSIGARWKNREPFGRRLGIPFIEGAS